MNKTNNNAENVDLSEQILEDLIKKGLSGQDLLNEFKRIKAGLPIAIGKLKDEALASETVSGDTNQFLNTLLDEEED